MSNQKKNVIENSLIEIDIDNCTKCKACIRVCPANLFYFKSHELNINNDLFEEYCIKCGHCVAVCPVEVIKLKSYKDKELKNCTKYEEIPTFSSLRNLMLTRRSIRQYKDKSIPKELIEKIMEVARYSPTASNTENVFYSIVQEKGIIKKLSETITENMSKFVELYQNEKGREILKKTMNEQNYQLAVENLPRTIQILKVVKQGIDFWCWDAPILIFIHGEKDIGGISGNSALAAAHIMLLAETLELSTCSLGYLKYFSNGSKKIKQMIGVPKNHDIGYCLSIGYPKVKYKNIPHRENVKIKWI